MNNLDMMRKRLEWQGGTAQESRMIKDKYRTFRRTLMYSYQGCFVNLVQHFDECLPVDLPIDSSMQVEQTYRALINPDKVKQNYDDKILSIDYDTGYQPGDVFYWQGTDTYWLITLQELTEDAYFRSEIRRCRYKIKFKDENGEIYETWAAIRGPVETVIESIQKIQTRVNLPNLGLNILMPLNDKTIKAFDRYDKFMLNGKVWRVQAHDAISMKNVYEIQAEEYFIDREKDDVQNGIVGGLEITPVDPTPASGIAGATFIMPRITEKFSVKEKGGRWSVIEKGFPVDIKPIDESTIDLTWLKATSGQFTLQWQKDDNILTKVVVVDSLF